MCCIISLRMSKIIVTLRNTEGAQRYTEVYLKCLSNRYAEFDSEYPMNVNQ